MNLMVSGLSAEEAVAWLAAIAAAISLGKQGVDALRKKRKEHDEIETALDHAPEVREQLQLGNVGAAVAHLNLISESQARYIRDQDTRIEGLIEQVRRLTDRNDATEAEAQGWEFKYNEEVRARREDTETHEREIAALRAELKETKRVFSRRIAHLTEQVDRQGGTDVVGP